MSHVIPGRQRAIANGDKFYIGSPCKRCTTRVRYLNGACVTCTMNKAEVSNRARKARSIVRLVTEAFL